MAKYNKNAAGYFETSRTINGKRVRFRGKTCAEVDRKILEYNTEQKSGRKFPVIADEWLDLREKELAHSTYKAYTYTVRRVKLHFTCRASEITPLDVKRYMHAFEAEGRSKGAAHLELTVIKQILSYAVLMGDIDVSPAAEVKLSKNLPEGKRSALTEEQEAKVEACRSGDWWLLGLMLLYTGCRRGELLALNWQDIDRDAGVIHVNKKLSYAYGNVPRLEDHLKSKNGKRDIPLFSPLAAALPAGRRIGAIFTDEDGRYLSQSRFYDVWQQYLSDVGITDYITPHCFRHSFSTICFEAGIDPKDAAAFMGDTEEIVRKVYTDLRQRHHADSIEKLNAFFEMRAQEREAK